MSKLACLPTVMAPYPPLKALPAELAETAALEALQKQASEKPFGKLTRSQYQAFVSERARKLRGVDFRWPFWVGVGAAGVALVALAAKR